MTDLMPEMILFCGDDDDAVGIFNPMVEPDPAAFIRITATHSLSLESFGEEM